MVKYKRCSRIVKNSPFDHLCLQGITTLPARQAQYQRNGLIVVYLLLQINLCIMDLDCFNGVVSVLCLLV